jgi:ribosomal protein S18 acetylase RimI-like enzyme
MDDYDTVLALWQAAGPGIEVRPSDARPEIAKKLGRDPDLFLVAEDSQGDVMGVIMGAWDGRRGWIHHLAVEESHRNCGIGAILIKAVEEALRAKGCLKVNLLVRRDNEAAMRLYRRLGYSDMSTIAAMGKEL